MPSSKTPLYFFHYTILYFFNILLCTFLGQTSFTLHKRDQSKCKFFRLFSAQIKIHQILVICDTKNKFHFKFCTTLIVRIGVSTPSKTPPGLSRHDPPQIDKLSKPLFLGNSPSMLVYHEPFLKFGSFSEPQKY